MTQQRARGRRARLAVAAVASLALLVASCSSSASDGTSSTTSKDTSKTTTTAAPSASKRAVKWMDGFKAPGTPAQYDKVGILKVGAADAPNVLVLEPGTSASAAYFVPLAQDIVKAQPTWQVWAVERRQNLLEDQSKLNAYKAGDITSTELYDYYLGYLKDDSVTDHFKSIPDKTVEFAKQWGLNVAIEDLHVVIDQAAKAGGKVVLGGHSLGGSVVTAYATWDFDGKPGADQLDGLVYIDGGSRPTGATKAEATKALAGLNADTASPWLSFGGITAPYAGLFNSTGSLTALHDPDTKSLGQASGLLPTNIVPPIPATNIGQYGYALNVGTSPPSLAAAQGHLGTGLTKDGGWNGDGAISPIKRFATMFSGDGIKDADGTEWYFPQRLTTDTSVVANGNANPGQDVLDVHATMGADLPKDLRIYAFGASLGGKGVTTTAQLLARQSGIADDHLTLVDRSNTYAHNDPAGAAPSNDFLDGLLPFLKQVGGGS
ncbi:hypothetical protein [Aquihabitans sp. McL0605]|uniref:alpha/beta hydrolase n=1 Tax=Aquihabitans sp. McL0605 TaxID=3415671 RepID=UPI003CF18766